MKAKCISPFAAPFFLQGKEYELVNIELVQYEEPKDRYGHIRYFHSPVLTFINEQGDVMGTGDDDFTFNY